MKRVIVVVLLVALFFVNFGLAFYSAYAYDPYWYVWNHQMCDTNNVSMGWGGTYTEEWMYNRYDPWAGSSYWSMPTHPHFYTYNYDAYGRDSFKYR